MCLEHNNHMPLSMTDKLKAEIYQKLLMTLQMMSQLISSTSESQSLIFLN